MSLVELKSTTPQSTSWEGLFRARKQLSSVPSLRASTSADLPRSMSGSMGVSHRKLLSLAVSRLQRLLDAGAILTATAAEALQVISVLVQPDSATPQISATSDSGVVVEWLVGGNNLVAQINGDSTVSVWGLDSEDIIQFEYEIPVRLFATSTDTLLARLYLTQISLGVTHRVAI